MKTKSKLEEKKLSKAELEAREKVIKDLKKNKSALVKRYGKDAEAVMYGRATNIAKKMAESENKNRIKELVRKALMQEADIEVMADKYGEEKALGQAAMMLDALEELLKKHDWYYMMSDDNRAYTQGSAQQYEIRKIMKQLEDIGYNDDAKALFNKYSPDGQGGISLKLKEVVIASEMTTEDALEIANRFAKYMSDKEGKTFTVTAGSVDGPSFDLDLDDVKYDGGSYIISTAGEILNMALPEHPVYAKVNKDGSISDVKITNENIPGKKEDVTGLEGKPDGKIDSKDYLAKRDAAIQKAKGEVKEDIDLGHEDNEPHMLKADLYRIGKYAMELYQMVDQFEGQGEVDFPSWWQAMITDSKEQMVKAKHYLDFEIKEPAIDAAVGVSTDEEPMMEAEISAEEKLAGKIAKALKDATNKDSSDQHNLKQARIALNKGNMDAAKKIAKPYLAEKIAQQLKSK